MKKMEALRKQLDFDLSYLDKSMYVLDYSLKKAQSIGIKSDYILEELDVYEALTSRYARTADILTQKVVKNLFMIMQEDTKTFIDRCNLSEKLEIINNAQELYNIRKLRNDIAHEYCIADISEIFKDVLVYSDALLKIAEKYRIYISENLGDLSIV